MDCTQERRWIVESKYTGKCQIGCQKNRVTSLNSLAYLHPLQ